MNETWRDPRVRKRLLVTRFGHRKGIKSGGGMIREASDNLELDSIDQQMDERILQEDNNESKSLQLPLVAQIVIVYTAMEPIRHGGRSETLNR